MSILNSKIEFDKKIKVFISSKCGDPRYDDVRNRLKILIEETGFASVYLFENRLASTQSAEQDYLYALDDSDVCIFLIDNADEIPDGVLKEYQRAKAQPKKSLFIFCNENNNNPTPIQKEITGSTGSKYYVANNFEEFVDIGYRSLIKDIGDIYINYCKGRLTDPEFVMENRSIEEIDANTSESLDKQLFKNIDKTKNLISNEIFTRSESNIENTCDLDNYSANFLNIVLNRKTVSEYNTNLLLSSLKEMQSENFHKVVIERWNSIQFYYLNNLEKAIETEKKALELARDLQLPNWIVQDILIDLKNLYNFEAQSKNQSFIDNDAQRELDMEKAALFHPLIDRYENYLHADIIKQSAKLSMKSPYSVTIGNNLSNYGDYIANIHIVAMFNGSLTQLLRITDRLQNTAFHLCNQFSDWEFRVLLLKMTLMKANKNEIKATIDLFNDVYGKMNAKDAKDIYCFVKGNPIDYQQNITKILAFQHLGYYFEDSFYEEVWQDISSIIYIWLNSDNRFILLGDYIFDAVSENRFRLDVNKLVSDILIKVFDNSIKRYYDKALEVLIQLDFSKVQDDNIKKIIAIYLDLVKDDFVRGNLRKLGSALISVRKQNQNLCLELDEVVMTWMPEFYENHYLLEIQTNSQIECESYIDKFIDKINNRNNTQGKNGQYTGYGDNPYQTIENIIIADDVILGNKLITKILQSCVSTLYAEKQTMSSKVYAIKLITFLRLNTEKIFDFDDLIDCLIKKEEEIFNGVEEVLLERTSRTTLHFNFSIMKLVFNRIKVEEILDLLSLYTDLEIFEKLEALKTIISIFKNDKNKGIDERVLLLFLQFTLATANDRNHDVRYYSAEALLYFLSEENKHLILRTLSGMMDYDSAYIKNKIMDFSEKIKSLDEESYKFIKEKARVDNHYLIRKRALES